MKTGCRAFTLIELLVVISVIGLISSVVVASLNAAREKARISAALRFDEQLYHKYAANAVGIWELDEGMGTSTADLSGNGFNGWFSGSPQWVDGVSGTALRFDGSNYLQFPDLRSRTDLVGGTSGKILFTAWIRPTEYQSGVYDMFATGFPGFLYFSVGPSRQLILMVNCPVSTYGCNTLNSNYWPTSASTIPLDKWTHVAFLMEAGIGYKFYINGKLDKEIVNTNFIIANMGGAQTAVGRSHSGTLSEFFRGDMDSIKFYYGTFD